MTISILFGKRILLIRNQKGITQAELAEKAGISPTYIGEIERGEKGVMLETISLIADAFDMPICQLFENIYETSTDYTIPMKTYELLLEFSPYLQNSCHTMIEAISRSIR